MARVPAKNIVILAALEMPIIGGAAFRFATSNGPDASPHLVPWMVATCLIAGLSLSVHQVMLIPHLKSPDPIPDEARRRALSFALCALGLAALLCIAGPAAFDRVLGV
ncbi:MAG: hypothetical protein QM817_02885 [Archangium sp.]